MRIPENLEQVCSLDPDYVGYIFYPGSKRYVGSKPDPTLFKLPPAEITKVGVFVNQPLATIIELYELHRLDMVQLHGNEPPEYCRELTEHGVAVIKALGPDANRMEYPDVVQLFLFDTPGPGWGGTGKKFDWNLIREGTVPGPFLMSGGIGPEDARAVRQLRHENFRGIDVNSRFERSPGLKDIPRLKEFIKEIRK
ncbi:MAG: phosphoribosylanthranilate isomerase [Bacteroidota bacterium]